MKLVTEGITRVFFRNRRNTNFFEAVAPTDFELAEGSLTAVVGKSGSGKTTFINMLSGLLRPTEGRVLLDGKDLYAMKDADRCILRNRCYGIVPQGQTGLQSLTVLENVLLPVQLYNPRENKTEAALSLLSELGIADLQDVFPNELSGGELRRMAIARALITDPAIIIADEPTGDLDETATQTVMNLFRLRASHGSSVLIVTHDNDAALRADHIYQMSLGSIVRASPRTPPGTLSLDPARGSSPLTRNACMKAVF